MRSMKAAILKKSCKKLIKLIYIIVYYMMHH